MIQSKRRYRNEFLSFLMSWNIQFFLGFLFIVVLSAILAWGWDWKAWIMSSNKFNSFLVMTIVYTLSFISLRRFLNYLGFLNIRYIIPAMLIWLAMGYGVLFVFRLHYSVYFLVASLLLMFLFFFLICYIRNHYGEFVAAYIPLGNLAGDRPLPKLRTVKWIKIVEPENFSPEKMDVIIADLHTPLGDRWEQFLAECTLQQTPVYHSSRLIEATSGRVRIDHLYENDLGSLLPSRSYLLIKRIFDIALVLCSLPLVLPIMLLTGLLIMLESRGGALFLQERIGEGGKPYMMYKFRSMYINSDNKQTQLSDTRITRIGKIIRKTRIDELPQFYNVLKGEMSLIGPRSEIVDFVESYKKDIPFYDYRHIVKPGISGWAQVMHGYTSDTEATKIKLEYDFYYIKNFSFSLDLLIFFKTIQTILTGNGAR